jgi:hypothetical protein
VLKFTAKVSELLLQNLTFKSSQVVRIIKKRRQLYTAVSVLRNALRLPVARVERRSRVVGCFNPQQQLIRFALITNASFNLTNNPKIFSTRFFCYA